jgi:NADPH:quinone reductase-like Zn-dependent oxidoreductase
VAAPPRGPGIQAEVAFQPVVPRFVLGRLQIDPVFVGGPKDGEVQVRVLAAGAAYPDLLMREGIHPEKPRLPFTPGWDLVGVMDRLGKAVSGIESGHTPVLMQACQQQPVSRRP